MFIWRTCGAKPLARLMARWADERRTPADELGRSSRPGNRVKPLDSIEPTPEDPAKA